MKVRFTRPIRCTSCGEDTHRAARDNPSRCSPSWVAAAEVQRGSATVAEAASRHGVSGTAVRHALARVRGRRAVHGKRLPTSCASCGKAGHAQAKGGAGCSPSFMAAAEHIETGADVTELAAKYKTDRSDINAAIRRLKSESK